MSRVEVFFERLTSLKQATRRFHVAADSSAWQEAGAPSTFFFSRFNPIRATRRVTERVRTTACSRLMKFARCCCLLLSLFEASSCVSPHHESVSLVRFEYQQPEMGVPFRIVLYAGSEADADRAAAAAFDRIKQLNDIMTDYDSDSELSRLGQTSGEAREVPVSPDLWRVLEHAQALAARSRGAFDITVGPVVNLWRKARREGKLPDPQRLAEARRSMGYTHLRLNSERRTVQLLVPNMRLDLGGVAKGYAADEALKVLRRFGITRALVAASGDIVVSDPPPGREGWRIQIMALDTTNAPPARNVLLSHAAISTSGDTFQRLEINGKRYSHVIDPRTGVGLTDHSLVSVIAKSGMTADSLTKVVSVLGPTKGLSFIEATPGSAARIVRKEDENVEVFESRRFSRFYERSSPESSDGPRSKPEATIALRGWRMSLPFIRTRANKTRDGTSRSGAF
jgi:FAD:protein FMN transferase